MKTIRLICICAVVLIGLGAFFVADQAPVVAANPVVQDSFGAQPASSPCLHQRREGVLLPLNPTEAAKWNLDSYEVLAEPDFVATDIRNLAVNVRAEFTLSPSPKGLGGELGLAFPLTTHALYGGNNEFRDVRAWIGKTPLPFKVAVNKQQMKTHGDGTIWYRKRMINDEMHPYLDNAADLRKIAPHLVAENYDIALLMYPTIRGKATLRVEYTTSANPYSQCCICVAKPTDTPQPYVFFFDFTNSRYWEGAREMKLELRDTASALFASVPDQTVQRVIIPGGVEIRGEGAMNYDLSIPVQPATFSVRPRHWPTDELGFKNPVVFEVQRMPGFGSDIWIQKIRSTPMVRINASLPLVINDFTAKRTFEATLVQPSENFGTQVAPPTYIDVFGDLMVNGSPSPTHMTTIRIPVIGQVISGHDLAVSGLAAVPDPDGVHKLNFRARVANHGWFPEEIVASIYVNRKFVKTIGVEGLINPMEEKEILFSGVQPDKYPALIEVEVEPIATETIRTNNRTSLIHPKQDSFIQ